MVIIMVQLVEKVIDGYNIVYNKNTEMWEIKINGIVDWETETEQEAVEWVKSKRDVNALETLQNLFGKSKVHKLSKYKIDEYLTYEEQFRSDVDTDNIFRVKFTSKKGRMTGKQTCKINGFIVICEMEDYGNYGDSKYPYWLIVSPKFID